MKHQLIHNEFEIIRFKEGMEDKIVYHIPMFGFFTKEECIESGFTPDFEKDKIYSINTVNGDDYVTENYFIVTHLLYGIKFKMHENDIPLFFKVK